ncbi:hypothetical protein [Aestuariirhabdus litorea]|uniref:Uncharacterized protein n=1 Tax=Aestuariirhabdus litorea TaxID=2528527 RepID=A0A3P3VPW5_9GAMM|nr:hypothetical protein [Aestuariirhabdus litorea]RRJ84831.1 hypothetical protein D0544_06995 [Aestuariirhabdus litorea]RWW98056.1 hypothetical protein DZC74_06990 [Endozoicomonadaceae bacterium GTF-13]
MINHIQRVFELISQGHFATIVYQGQRLSDAELNALAYMVEHRDPPSFAIPELNRALGLKSFDAEPVSHLLAQLSSSCIEITLPEKRQHIELISRYSIRPPKVICEFPAAFIELVTTGDLNRRPN